jgi:hypothetical protein
VINSRRKFAGSTEISPNYIAFRLLADQNKIVTLTWYERILATQIGMLRTTEAERTGRSRPTCSGEPSWINDAHSAGTEEAVGKFLCRYWLAGVNKWKDPDVAPNIEVRRTNPRNVPAKLKVKLDDPDDRRYVLVRGELPTYEMVGWLWGHEAKRSQWLEDFHDYGMAYWAPESELRTDFKLSIDEEEMHWALQASLDEYDPERIRELVESMWGTDQMVLPFR